MDCRTYESIYSLSLHVPLGTVSQSAAQLYFTAYKLSKMYHTGSPQCWQEFGSDSSLAHIFWHCPSLQRLWGDVYHFVDSLNGTPVTRSRELSLLHIGIHTLASDCRTVDTHLLLITTLLIVRHWKQTQIPRFMDVISDLN